jgi:hypothetical protein
VNTVVPSGGKLYLLRLPENQVTYYLTPKLVRVDVAEEAVATVAAAQTPQLYALAPEFLAHDLSSLGKLEVLARCASVNRYLKPNERMTFIRLTRQPEVASAASPTQEAH